MPSSWRPPVHSWVMTPDSLPREPANVSSKQSSFSSLRSKRQTSAQPTPATPISQASVLIMDAVFVCNDHMAFAVLGVLHLELGLRTPEDVAVVGFDDIPMAAWPEYDLTTVRQSMSRLVKRTVEILLARVEIPALPAKRFIISTRLIERGTTRKGAV